MNKTDKFVALRAFLSALGFTKSEFKEFVESMKSKLAEEQEGKFTLGVGYVYNDKIKTAHHLMEGKKEYIWGISLGNVLWSKDKVDASWLEATKAMDIYVSGSKLTSLPDRGACMYLWRERERFSQTAEELRKCGVTADGVDPDDVYWVLNGDQAFIVGSDGKPVAKTDDIKTAKLRLCVFM